MKTLYFFIHIFTVSFPLIRSFEPKINYASRWKYLFPSIILTAIFFIIWDIQFARTGVWGFNERYTLGIHFWQLPIEEWLFFFTVPFASVFIYDCVKYFLPDADFPLTAKIITFIVAFGLIILAILNKELDYTFWNFLFCGVFLSIIFLSNPHWLTHFWIAYLIHLVPFLMVNGLLTGSFIDEPVVWYNDQENLSIRIFTIPIEDLAYALLLLVCNISIYELLKKQFPRRTISLTNQL